MTTEPEFITETRAFYDAVAADYTAAFRGHMDSSPVDRAVLGIFAELVRSERPDGKVAELGCGAGRVTGYLHRELGLDVSGVDLSPGMVELARRDHSEVEFTVGSLFELPYGDGGLTGALAWYSLIHTPAEELPRIFAEFARVLAPGGHLVMAFQAGDEPSRQERPWGHPVTLDFRRLRPERVEELSEEAGLPVTFRSVREPEAGEKAQQAYLLARKPKG
ncbi:class I SAM-dependent methyltransferase [Kitasatospora sp. NPDC101183]|uniref:class I SAM-dependent methyltransferase n=1 Tax=Kitasatospora sp. NPDC101183 TaxID=3364100 RepID=UPI00380E5E5F